jgi:hypothetical protein
MRERLTAYLGLLDEYLEAPQVREYLKAPLTRDRPENQTRAELRRRERTVKEILGRLDPALADFNLDGLGGEAEARNAIDRGLGSGGRRPCAAFSAPAARCALLRSIGRRYGAPSGCKLSARPCSRPNDAAWCICGYPPRTGVACAASSVLRRFQ